MYHCTAVNSYQRWSRGQKARGQGQGPNKFRGQGQTPSRPRPRTKDKGQRRKCSPKKKVFKIFFQAKKVFKNFFSSDLYLRKPKKRSLQIFCKVSGVFQRNFNGLKIVLSSSRGRAIFEDLRLRGQDQGLQNVSSRPRTSSRTPPLIRINHYFSKDHKHLLPTTTQNQNMRNIENLRYRKHQKVIFATKLYKSN